MITFIKKRFARISAEPTLKVHGHSAPYTEITTTSQPDAPLIIGIHGYGASAEQMKTLVNITLDFPHTYIAPQALHRHPTSGFMWFPIDASGGEIAYDDRIVDKALDTIDAFIAGAIEQYQADPRRVMFVGYSQGGMLAYRYLLRHPQRVMGCVALAGSFDQSRIPAGDAVRLDGKGLFIGTGTRDGFVTSAETESAREYFHAHNVDVTHRSYPIPHVVSQAEVADVSAWLSMYLANSSESLDSQAT